MDTCLVLEAVPYRVRYVAHVAAQQPMVIACPACTFACDDGALTCPICTSPLATASLRSCPACTFQQDSKRQTCELCGCKLDDGAERQNRPAGKMATAIPTPKKTGTKRKQQAAGAPPGEWPGIRSFFGAATSAQSLSSQQPASARASAISSTSVRCSEIIDLLDSEPPSQPAYISGELSVPSAPPAAAAAPGEVCSSAPGPGTTKSELEALGVELGPEPRPEDLELPLAQFLPRRAGCGGSQGVPYKLVATALDALESTRR